ncbi:MULTISPECIES: hypothetical protein [unclassified Paenibacillus]|uniref:hypothetical protein n=1 Tax=unclassified Paenibacillus TaxID=185978 RepID=UPI0009553A99|nr:MULTISPECIES: hypothetical protein [unclassified Paenibacillus]ASS68863.1 hypothetical protein CIC07_24110 [Paenibacillus sp. RUD330]SIR17522.1 hypothetical protein SAMN05880555_3207 [Paenibacillus sp. RU4X]SIR21273.1 hypothetical protein SAMN05880570_2790 [Paenibacillus sp. RU4T]
MNLTRKRQKGARSLSLAPASLALMSMLMLASGCGAKNDAPANASAANNGGVVDSSQGVSPDSVGDPVAEATPSPDKAGTAPKEEPTTQSQEQKGSGTYNGLADGHSVEITTDTDTVVFQAATDQIKTLQDIETGEKVDFTYIVKELDTDSSGKVQQRWITSIQKSS